MLETLTTKMQLAISKVLETMFFTPVQVREGESHSMETWFSGDPMLTRARIEFTGPFSGRFSLLIPADMVGGIAANFLGMEENELVKVNKDDTIKEALNMVSGYTLSQMENAEDFQLGIPEILPGKESDTELLNDSQGKVLFIETEKQRLALVIQLD